METLQNNIRQACSDLNAIKEAIVENGVSIPEGARSSTYANKIDNVYEVGREKGQEIEQEKAAILNDELEQILYGTDTGGKSYYDEFWDSVQNNGAVMSGYYLFSGNGWTPQNFKPKHNIALNRADYLFMYAQRLNCSLIDILETQGVKLDTSKATTLSNAFAFSAITELPEIDTTACTAARAIDATFGQCQQLRKIEKFTIKANHMCTSLFLNCYALEEVELAGVLAVSLNMSYCSKLNKTSITSLIGILSTTTTDLTVTLSLTAVNKAFETSEGANDGSTSTEWTTLINTRKNWTISLV